MQPPPHDAKSGQPLIIGYDARPAKRTSTFISYVFAAVVCWFAGTMILVGAVIVVSERMNPPNPRGPEAMILGVMALGILGAGWYFVRKASRGQVGRAGRKPDSPDVDP